MLYAFLCISIQKRSLIITNHGLKKTVKDHCLVWIILKLEFISKKNTERMSNEKN